MPAAKQNKMTFGFNRYSEIAYQDQRKLIVSYLYFTPFFTEKITLIYTFYPMFLHICGKLNPIEKKSITY